MTAVTQKKTKSKTKATARGVSAKTKNAESDRLADAKRFIDTVRMVHKKPGHGGGVAEVAERLGLSETAVVSRSYAYRKREIDVPLFPSGGQAYDWGALQSYAGKRSAKAKKTAKKALAKPKKKASAKPKAKKKSAKAKRPAKAAPTTTSTPTASAAA